MSYDTVVTEKTHGVWYAWFESHPSGVRSARKKRDAVEAVHRSHTKGLEGERLNFQIIDRLIDLGKKNRHPVLTRIASSRKMFWNV